VLHLCEQFPELGPHIYEAGGGITKFAGTPRASDRGEGGELRETPPAVAGGGITEYLTMFLNDRPVLDLDMVLGEGDEVLMMFPVSGG
jgi:molybdopterin converting factor small subunit